MIVVVHHDQALTSAEELEQIILEYEKYNTLFSAIEDIDDAEDNGFRIIEEQSFPVLLESFLDGETVNFALLFMLKRLILSEILQSR